VIRPKTLSNPMHFIEIGNQRPNAINKNQMPITQVGTKDSI
jgi:hypothetical protein